MKSIKNVKLGFNKNAEVTVVADVEMKDENDIDSLFLCFFTIFESSFEALDNHIRGLKWTIKPNNRPK